MARGADPGGVDPDPDPTLEKTGSESRTQQHRIRFYLKNSDLPLFFHFKSQYNRYIKTLFRNNSKSGFLDRIRMQPFSK